MRRIAHVVVSDNFAGVERYISYIAAPLASAGIDTTVIGGRREQMVEAVNDPRVRHLPGRTLTEATRSLVKVGHVDLVHVHMTAAEFAGMATKPVLRAPIVSTRHFAAKRGTNILARAARPIIARSINRQLAISAFVSSRVDGEATVLLNGVPESALGGHKNNVVLVAQRLEIEKETQVAINAWALSGLAERGWRLVIAGAGSGSKNLLKLTDELGVNPSVEFVGFRPDIRQLMMRSAIFLATAPAEPFGLSVVEAMATGLPVVAAAGGAHSETVGAVSRQFLFRPTDHTNCAELLKILALDADLRRRYGSDLRQHQKLRLSVDRHASSLLEIYEDVIRMNQESGGP